MSYLKGKLIQSIGMLSTINPFRLIEGWFSTFKINKLYFTFASRMFLRATSIVCGSFMLLVDIPPASDPIVQPLKSKYMKFHEIKNLF